MSFREPWLFYDYEYSLWFTRRMSEFILTSPTANIIYLQSQSRVGNPTNDSTMYAEILVIPYSYSPSYILDFISRISYNIGIPAFLLISKFFSIIELICLICATGISCRSRIVTPPLIYQLNSNRFLCSLSSSFSNFFVLSAISSPLAVANQLRKNLQDSSPV